MSLFREIQRPSDFLEEKNILEANHKQKQAKHEEDVTHFDAAFVVLSCRIG